MSLARWAARRDENEREIINALLEAGASVDQINMAGKFDLDVGYKGVTYHIEIKRNKKARLTKYQKAWLENHKGGPTAIVTTVDEALRFIGAK